MEIRTRFAPSPTGYMHIGNLRTALYEFLIAKSNNGKFILRIEDTDQQRLVDGATDIIYKTLEITGLKHDEGPDIGGNYGPYVQSERMGIYKKYADELVKKKQAYYCFCTKERLESLKVKNKNGESFSKYDRHCMSLSDEQIKENIENKIPYVIRQKMPTEGQTTFFDAVYGDITVENSELDDQILIKADGFPTYNFANVVDDYIMNITHVVRGSEYLSSTPKYTLLYKAFGWNEPKYVHLPPVMRDSQNKLSKRKGDKSFDDLLNDGYIPEAIINYIALLGWSPSDNKEIFSLKELIENFDISSISKSPSIFDIKKLKWINSEYIKNMDREKYISIVNPIVEKCITNKNIDTTKVSMLLQKRLETLNDIPNLVEFFNNLCEYDTELYIHKKMKTNKEISLDALKQSIPVIENIENWTEENLHDELINLVNKLGMKNGQILWPIRTALSGVASSAGGAIEIAEILGKEETLRRIKIGIDKLS